MNTNKLILTTLIVSLLLLIPMNASADALGHDFCVRTDQTWRFVGYMLLFTRILVPLGIIAMGTLDFYQAIVSDKSDDMKKYGVIFGKRILAGVMIFLIPTILNISFTLISNWSDVADQYEECLSCLLAPRSCVHRSPVPGIPPVMPD